MCMIGDDTWKIYRQETRKARKEHRCSECRRTIEPGEPYEYVTGLTWDWDGWCTEHTCAHCVQAKRWLLVFCHGYLFEMVHEDLSSHINEGEEGYMHTDQLAELVGWMEARWAGPDGDLRSVEAVADLTGRAIAATHDLVARASRGGGS